MGSTLFSLRLGFRRLVAGQPVAGFVPASGGEDGLGGHETRPYEDYTRAPMHPLAPSQIVISSFQLIAIGGKAWFLLLF